MTSMISSISNEASLAAGAGANATIVSLSAAVLTQPGVYRIRPYVSFYGAAPTAADAGNVKLVVGSFSQVLNVPSVAGMFGPWQFMVQLDGSTAVSLQTATAGPSVATYSGLLVAEFLGRNGQLAKYI